MLSLYTNEFARRSTWTCLLCTARVTYPFMTSPEGRSSALIHQRKYSSSKAPSHLKDETGAIAAAAKTPSEEAKSVTSPEAADRAPGARARKRKVKEGGQDAVARDGENARLNLPSVPSTKHIAPLGTLTFFVVRLIRNRNLYHLVDIQVASFFSQHRPMSVSHVIPPVITPQAFSSLFDPPKPTSKSKATDVIHTLSSAVDAFEHVPSQQHGPTPEEFDLRIAVTQASSSSAEDTAQHLDPPAKSLHINLQELAKRFRPFVPPAPPAPLGAMREAARQSSWELKEQQPSKQTTWTSTLTVYERTEADGKKYFKTYASPIVKVPTGSSFPPPNAREIDLVQKDMAQEDPACRLRHLPPAPRGQPFLGRMRKRQISYGERMDERFNHGVMQMISVKRQRKLKMKKHKYKKLMKRTKNLRRRLDRT